MTKNQQYGYDVAKGAVQYLALLWLVAAGLLGLVHMLCNINGVGVDSTDLSGWERSGLTLHTDYRTGVQYLSDGKGGLTPRIQRKP